MSRPSRRAGAPVVAALATAAVLLSGCGVADGGSFQPGVAAVVGDSDVALSDVDRTADGICDYLTDAAQDSGQGQAIPRGDLRSQIVQLLAQREAAEQLLDETGAELDPGYQEAIAQNEAQLADLPTDQADALREGNEAGIYYEAALLGVGARLLDEEGAPGDQEAAFARGGEAVGDWLDEHDVEINPLFDVVLDDGALAPAPANRVSVASGALATLGAAERATPQDTVRQDYAAALPAEQRCGG